MAEHRAARTIDPGMATVVAAALALVGTVVTVILHDGPGGGGGGNPTTTSVHTTTTTTSAPPPGPVVQVVAGLSDAQKQAVDQAAAAILAVGNRMPLIVEGGFDERNAPGWSVGSHTYDGGITCTQAIAHKAWNLTVASTNGGAYCTGGVTQVASDFVVTMGTALSTTANADISLFVRASSDLKNGYQVTFNPQTQQFWENVIVAGTATPLIRPTFTAEITKNGANTLAVLAVGTSQTIYVNDKVVAMVSQESRVSAAGQTRIQVQLNEANGTETLSVDRFDIHGQAALGVASTTS